MQSMSDDPRQILAEAGVECAEVETWAKSRLARAELFNWDPDYMLSEVPGGGQAILALARLVAKYKRAVEGDDDYCEHMERRFTCAVCGVEKCDYCQRVAESFLDEHEYEGARPVCDACYMERHNA